MTFSESILKFSENLKPIPELRFNCFLLRKLTIFQSVIRN